MEHATTTWDSGRFNRRVTTFAHAMIIISLAVVWLILLKAVLQPFFIALGILTAFLGFLVNIPLLGYATWHRYRDTFNLVDWEDRINEFKLNEEKNI